MRNIITLAFTACMGLVLASAGPAHATVLVPGGTVVPSFLPRTPPVGGLVTSTSGTMTSDLGPLDFTGSYSEFLLRGNSYGANDLTWYIEVTNNNVPGNSDIQFVTASSFRGFQTDVGYCETGSCMNEGTMLPTSVSRNSNGGAINFAVDIPADGSTTDWLMIETNASEWKPGNLSFQNDGNVTVAAFAPNVPEPSTWAMMLLGFAGLGFAGYRTSRKAVSIAV